MLCLPPFPSALSSSGSSYPFGERDMPSQALTLLWLGPQQCSERGMRMVFCGLQSSHSHFKHRLHILGLPLAVAPTQCHGGITSPRSQLLERERSRRSPWGKKDLPFVFLKTPPLVVSWGEGNWEQPYPWRQPLQDTAFNTGWDDWTPLCLSPPAAHGRQATRSRRLMMSLQSTN